LGELKKFEMVDLRWTPENQEIPTLINLIRTHCGPQRKHLLNVLYTLRAQILPLAIETGITSTKTRLCLTPFTVRSTLKKARLLKTGLS